MPTGAVLDLWRWPVKSMGGERVRALRVDGRGAGGDRTHAVVGRHKGALRPLTAREAPGLLAWSAAYPSAPDARLDPADPPLATLTRSADGRSWRWDDPGLPRALAEDLGRPVELRRHLDGIHDLPRSVLVTTEATLRALSEELGEPIDLRRFRPNLHLRLDAPAWAEAGWEGGELVLAGGVRLRFLHPCQRCAIPTRDPETRVKWPGLLRHLAARHDQLFGINARVVAAGRVETGEQVRVEAGRPSGSGASGR